MARGITVKERRRERTEKRTTRKRTRVREREQGEWVGAVGAKWEGLPDALCARPPLLGSRKLLNVLHMCVTKRYDLSRMQSTPTPTCAPWFRPPCHAGHVGSEDM